MAPSSSSSSSHAAPVCHSPFSSLTVAILITAVLTVLIATPRSHTHAHHLPHSPLLIPLSRADRSENTLPYFLTAALTPDNLDSVQHRLSSELEEEEEKEREEAALQRRQLSPLSFLTAAKRRGGWKKIPIEPRFAPFGSKLILTRGRQESRGPSILRYGRSV